MKTLTEFSALTLRRGADARAAKTAEGVATEAMAEAVASTLSIPGERATRLLEALDVVGANLEQVRLVRVFQGETGPQGATTIGEFHYAIDRVPSGGGGGRDRGRGDRRGGDRRGGPGRGGDRPGGGGGFGDRRGPPKPRGLGSLKAQPDRKPEDNPRDDRPQRGEIPRAGIGWVLTAAPRDPRDERGGPRRGRGPRRDGRGRGPGGPGGPRNDGPRGPRPPRSDAQPGEAQGAPDGERREPRRGRGRRGGGGPRPEPEVVVARTGDAVARTGDAVNQPAAPPVQAPTETPANQPAPPAPREDLSETRGD